MSLTPTREIPLGFTAPEFNLINPNNNKLEKLKNLQSDKGTLIIFMCNHCPFVVHILPELVNIAYDYINKGISFIAINSNDIVSYPQDSPKNMIKLVKEYNIPFPYLFDESQEVARAYSAECTPDLNIFDGNMKCVYRGQIDSSRPGNNKEKNGYDIRQALNKIISGELVSPNQIPSIGCNIKWK